jgi:signal transduction histidine kinase/ActR/RegA family two-component response regulator
MSIGPTPPQLFEERVRWRVLHLVAGLLIAVVLAYASAYAVAGRWRLFGAEIGAAAAFLAAYGVAWWRRDAGRGIQWLALVSWLVLAGVVVIQGGLTSPALTWLLVLAPLALLGGAWFAEWMAAATALFALGLYFAERFDWLPTPDPPSLAHRAISAALITLLFLLFAGYSLHWRNLLARELSSARDAALDAARLKDRFIAHLNHEIRTPMNAMITAADLLARRPRTEDERALVDALQRSAAHLRSLVDDVLDHARLEAGGLKLESRAFSVRETVCAVVDMFAPAAAAKGLELQWHAESVADGIYQGDELRVRQVLANLVSNAIKMTSAGHVRIEIDHVGGQGPLILRVRDSGAGMSDELRDRLFAPFAQGPTMPGEQLRGSGLGLSICRELVALMGGRIDVESQPGRGSCFSVLVPLPAIDHRQAAPPPGSPKLEKRSRVLLVEDDEVNCLVMCSLLANLGAEVTVARDGAQALLRLHDTPVDLVLMDCQMPVLDGFAAVQQWRVTESDMGRTRTPILALTGDADLATRARCLADGMDDVLTKPIAPDSLRKALDSWATGAPDRSRSDTG